MSEPTSRRRILIVEDEFLIRMTLAECLADEEFDVVEAATGDEALATLASDAGIDLLLTDIQLPGGLDGVNLARSVREGRPDLPVIFVTGRPDAMPDPVPSVRDALVPKPYLPSEVASIARRLTGGRWGPRDQADGPAAGTAASARSRGPPGAPGRRDTARPPAARRAACPSSPSPIGTVIAGWRVRLKAKVHGRPVAPQRLAPGRTVGASRAAVRPARSGRAPDRSSGETAPSRARRRARSASASRKSTALHPALARRHFLKPGIEQRAPAPPERRAQAARQRHAPDARRRWRAYRAAPGSASSTMAPASSSSCAAPSTRGDAVRVRAARRSPAGAAARPAGPRRPSSIPSRQSRASSGRQKGRADRSAPWPRTSARRRAPCASSARRRRRRRRRRAAIAGRGR